MHFCQTTRPITKFGTLTINSEKSQGEIKNAELPLSSTGTAQAGIYCPRPRVGRPENHA